MLNHQEQEYKSAHEINTEDAFHYVSEQLQASNYFISRKIHKDNSMSIEVKIPSSSESFYFLLRGFNCKLTLLSLAKCDALTILDRNYKVFNPSEEQLRVLNILYHQTVEGPERSQKIYDSIIFEDNSPAYNR
jgi:uncharacterized membrane protein YukC